MDESNSKIQSNGAINEDVKNEEVKQSKTQKGGAIFIKNESSRDSKKVISNRSKILEQAIATSDHISEYIDNLQLSQSRVTDEWIRQTDEKRLQTSKQRVKQ